MTAGWVYLAFADSETGAVRLVRVRDGESEESHCTYDGVIGAEAIVYDLAASDVTYWHESSEFTICTLCGGEGSGTLREPEQHSDDCIWKRAREWVTSHPRSPGEGSTQIR